MKEPCRVRNFEINIDCYVKFLCALYVVFQFLVQFFNQLAVLRFDIAPSKELTMEQMTGSRPPLTRISDLRSYYLIVLALLKGRNEVSIKNKVHD